MSEKGRLAAAPDPEHPALAMALLGYARVSTDKRTLPPQTAAPRVTGCARIHEE